MSAHSEHVPAVERTMRILALLAHAQRPLSCSEISVRLKIPRTSTHMIVKTLEAHMFLQKASRHGYRLGAALLAFGRADADSSRLADRVAPWLRQLSDRTRLPVRFALFEGSGPIVVAATDAEGVADNIDLHTSPLGMCLLAGLPESEIARLVNSIPSDDAAGLMDGLQALRTNGFIAGPEPGGAAQVTVAAPMVVPDKAATAVGVTGAARDLRSARLEFVGREAVRTAELLAAHLGPFLPPAFHRISATGVP